MSNIYFFSSIFLYFIFQINFEFISEIECIAGHAPDATRTAYFFHKNIQLNV